MFENMLRKCREEKKMSQLELGRLSRIAPSVISMIEAGKQYPFPGWQRRIAEVLEVQEKAIFPD